MYELYFGHSDNPSFIGEYESSEKVRLAIKNKVKEIHFKSYYWNVSFHPENFYIRIDYGSHVKFFYVLCGNKKEYDNFFGAENGDNE